MVILQPFLILGSAIGITGITIRRFHLNKKANKIQKELEKQQRQEERSLAKMNYHQRRQKIEAKKSEAEKKVSRENIIKVNELMKQVHHLLEQKEEENALKILIQVTALDKNNRKANETLAGLYLKHDQNQKAELIYETLIEKYPQDPVYRSNLAHSFYNRRQFKLAIPEYEKALDLDKGNPVRYINLGHVYATKRDLNSAVEYYKKACRISVRDTDLMFLIIETSLQKADPITAREFLHKILEYEPYNARAKEMLSEVIDLLQHD